MTDREQLLVSAIQTAIGYLESLPPGIDPDPDINETSPEDTVYYTGGIAAKVLREAIEGREWP